MLQFDEAEGVDLLRLAGGQRSRILMRPPAIGSNMPSMRTRPHK